MLVQLAIRDIVLIDRLELAFGPGLTVLTGETGAGKSILLDAFSLALGGRGDGSLVRSGEPQGQVIAVFDPPPDHPARLAAARTGASSRGRPDPAPRADGRRPHAAPLSTISRQRQALRAIGASSVEIHGQHDDRALVDPAAHRTLLDALAAMATCWPATRAAHAVRQARRKRRCAKRRRRRRPRARKPIICATPMPNWRSSPPRAGEEEELAARARGDDAGGKGRRRPARRAGQRFGRRLAALHAFGGACAGWSAASRRRPR